MLPLVAKPLPAYVGQLVVVIFKGQEVPEEIIAALAASVVVAIFAFFIHRRIAKKIYAELQCQLERANDAERQVHLKELGHLTAHNQNEIAHADVLSAARGVSFDEGRKQGRAEYELEASIRLADQRGEFADRLEKEKIQAAAEARDRLRAEYELQAKLFTVKVSPYIQLLTNKGMISDSYEANTGYQYQLLVNGIPAFQPHIIVEQQEKIKAINDETKKILIDTATLLADSAIKTFLGTDQQFAVQAPAIIKELVK